MRWLADECVYGSVVLHLRNAGHDVIYAAEVLQEAEDVDLADLAMNQNRLILTEDRDFGRIIFRNERTVPGIVYFRLSIEERRLQWSRLQEVIAYFGENLYGYYVVIAGRGFRFRPLPDQGGG